MSRTQRENIFTQATFSQKVWKVAVAVMDLYEQGQLKDQRLNRKQLVSTPEFRQHLLLPIHHLKPEFQYEILSEVATKEKSLSDLKQAAVHFRQMENIRRAFVTCTKCSCWEEATHTYPLYTQEKRLEKFINLDFKSVPDLFRNFCQSAVSSTCTSNAGGEVAIVLPNGNFVCVIEEEPLTVTGQQLQSLWPTFNGAHFALANISEVRSYRIN